MSSVRCSCLDCRYPAVGDVAVKAAHAEFHRRFEAIVAEQPDWHGFRPPTPRRIVELSVEEWTVPAACVRVEHVGSPSHPAHRA